MKYTKVLINSLITGFITMLSSMSQLDLTQAWIPALIAALIAGVLSGLIEFQKGFNKGPPAGRLARSKKASSRLDLFCFF